MQAAPSNIHALIREEAGTLVKGVTFSKYCKTCLHVKAARMHHCHVCKKCVSRMDHRRGTQHTVGRSECNWRGCSGSCMVALCVDCPWIGGCVGFANYR